MSRVRPARLDDLDALAAIASNAFSNAWSRDALAGELARSWARVLVAEDEDQDGKGSPRVVGFVNFWLVADEVHVLNVATDPAFRRRGHARALVAAMIDTARAHGAQLLLLEVRPTNVPAIRLYESFGFREVGRRPAYYEDGEDALLMNARVDG